MYSRPTTSAAMSVVSASSYFSETERRNVRPSESILEGSDEDGNESETDSEVESNAEEEKGGEEGENLERDEMEEELTKAEREEERKRLKA